MKKFGFLFFLLAMVIITLSSSTCRTPPQDEEIIIDTNSNNTGGNTTVYGVPVIATVHIETSAGNGAGGAIVKLAYTLDSAVNEKYIPSLSDSTDGNGRAEFLKLPLDQATKSKTYYANAYFSQGGDELTSMNGGKSNGPVPFTVRSTGAALNISIIVTSK